VLRDLEDEQDEPKVQWGDNQNGVFEIAVKEISHLPTLTAS